VKFKLDENLSPDLVPLFTEGGHEVHTVLGEGISGINDALLYGQCVEERRILVSLDLDYTNPLRFSPKNMAGIIVLRPRRYVLPLIRKLVAIALTHMEKEAPYGKLWIVEPRRIRVYDPLDHQE
jgi:predicted nuclease of predicted toxin-antitoxin system